MSNAEILSPLAQKHIDALFREMESKLYTSINTFHIDLRQELLSLVSAQIDNAVEEALEDYRLRERPSKFFTSTQPESYEVPGISVVLPVDYLPDASPQKVFPSPSTPWDDGVTGKTYATFPPARIVSPIEIEREEEDEIVQKKEEGRDEGLLLAIEELINQKITALATLTTPVAPLMEEQPVVTPLPPEPEKPVYTWGNYDPMAYARSAPNLPGGFH